MAKSLVAGKSTSTVLTIRTTRPKHKMCQCSTRWERGCRTGCLRDKITVSHKPFDEKRPHEDILSKQPKHGTFSKTKYQNHINTKHVAAMPSGGGRRPEIAVLIDRRFQCIINSCYAVCGVGPHPGPPRERGGSAKNPPAHGGPHGQNGPTTGKQPHGAYIM